MKMILEFESWELAQIQLEFCNKFMGHRWTVDDKGEIVVRGDISIINFKGKELPVQFSDTSSNFTLKGCKNLESLKGVPRKAYEFRLESCPKILTLENSPLEVRKYKIDDLTVKDLKGSSQEVTEVFNCSNNEYLSSFEGAPSKVNIFYASYCPMITTLFGAPIAESYFIDNDRRKEGNITHPQEVEWIKSENTEMIHLWLKSGMKIEEFLEKKKGMITGKKYGL